MLYTVVSPSEILAHLQYVCNGLHALDVLALKNEMQHYHQDMEGLPEYVNAIKDVQKLSKRVGNTITEDNLLLIAIIGMLSAERFPQAGKI